MYTLDRLDLDAKSTLNSALQAQVLSVSQKLKDPEFIDNEELRQEQLLLHGDPAQINYSFTLFERTTTGNALRVQADTLNQPFDLNEGMKLELGSTAKLRTLAHYLEVISSLHSEFQANSSETPGPGPRIAQDPITRWVAEIMNEHPDMDLSTLLNEAMDRQYSGNPNEVFFTGGGEHIFASFGHEEDGVTYTLREGFEHSVNLVYIRLLRDLVQYHKARLPYDTEAVMD